MESCHLATHCNLVSKKGSVSEILLGKFGIGMLRQLSKAMITLLVCPHICLASSYDGSEFAVLPIVLFPDFVRGVDLTA